MSFHGVIPNSFSLWKNIISFFIKYAQKWNVKATCLASGNPDVFFSYYCIIHEPWKWRKRLCLPQYDLQHVVHASPSTICPSTWLHTSHLKAWVLMPSFCWNIWHNVLNHLNQRTGKSASYSSLRLKSPPESLNRTCSSSTMWLQSAPRPHWLEMCWINKKTKHAIHLSAPSRWPADPALSPIRQTPVTLAGEECVEWRMIVEMELITSST